MAVEPIRARVDLIFGDMRTAQVVYQAISPDNHPLPRGLELKAAFENTTIVMEIICHRPLQSLLATLDDILRMAALAENMAETVRKL
jgi:tRNA threonylcarbamoyladenosine modification (KEOPS) complex  Pcc1 subunit